MQQRVDIVCAIQVVQAYEAREVGDAMYVTREGSVPIECADLLERVSG
jgi:hypothetical protein